ncbi:hypothetical protein [Streptomyces shaanxiensis]
MRNAEEQAVDTTGAGGTQETHDTLEQRVRNLEQRVETLTAAVRALAEGLELSPSNGADDGGRGARGARLAHEILLSRGL